MKTNPWINVYEAALSGLADVFFDGCEAGEGHRSGLCLCRALLIRESGCCDDINAFKCLRPCDLEEHHSGFGDAVVSPGADRRHAHLEEACGLGSTTKGVDDLCCVRVHGPMLAQANVLRKPRLTIVLLG